MAPGWRVPARRRAWTLPARLLGEVQPRQPGQLRRWLLACRRLTARRCVRGPIAARRLACFLPAGRWTIRGRPVLRPIAARGLAVARPPVRGLRVAG